MGVGAGEKCSGCWEAFWQAIERGDFKRWVRGPLPRRCALRPQRMLKTKQTETHHVPRLRCDEQAWMHTPAMPASAVRRSRASAQGRRAWESGACSHPRHTRPHP